MLKSKDNHPNKIDPLVGAVLVDQEGNMIDKAHRGILREGDHAEYSLIERILGDRDLSNSTLYVTLEPCTSRRSKTPCADRIITARINKVFVGMIDPHPKIHGKGIIQLQEADIDVQFFDSDISVNIREENKDFIDQFDEGIEESLREIGEFKGSSSLEGEPVDVATIDDLDISSINNYSENTIGRKFKDFSDGELIKFLKQRELLVNSSEADFFNPTKGGLMLFGGDPSGILPQITVKVESHRGGTTFSEDISVPLLSLPYKILDFIKMNIRYRPVFVDLERTKVPEYPVVALREAIVNAIVHRDYQKGMHIYIQIYDDRLVIKSPGLLLSPLSLDAIRSYNAQPYSRNPRIAEVFSHMNLMEERGWGIKTMRDLLTADGLPEPYFSQEGDYFIVTFYNSGFSTNISFSSGTMNKLEKTERRIIEILHETGRISTKEVMEELDIANSTAYGYLKNLKKYGIIVSKGSGRSTYYLFNED